jgi:uncharacterized repeat protein (TIGR03803 family)
MTNQPELSTTNLRSNWRLPAFALATFCALTITAWPSAQAQNYAVIYNFSGAGDISNPVAITMDQRGNIYGDDQGGCCGGVFRLHHADSGWILNALYVFPSRGNDGGEPGAVTIGPNGTLYAANGSGGNLGGECGTVGCGTVINLRPSPTACATSICPWKLTLLYGFSSSGNDGQLPSPVNNVIFDHAGNLYGTTQFGGAGGNGTVYKLTPANGGWTETIVHSFSGGNDGAVPYTGVIIDQAGNFYGTTAFGGAANSGTVYEISPSGSGSTEKVLYSFQNGNDGNQPWGNLVLDSSGNLYGTASLGGAGNGGTVFELIPSGGGWTFNLIYALQGTGGFGPTAGLVMDTSGNLYGTTVGDGAYEDGSVYKLTRSGGSWIYTDLHDFTGGSDGGQAWGPVSLDSNGDIYGAAKFGGAYQCSSGAKCGVVFEITP